MVQKTINRKQCLKCLHEKVASTQFYKSNSDNHADGRFPICKECVKGRLKLDNPLSDEAIQSVKDILFEMNRPFLYSQYVASVEEYGTGNELFGKYLKNIQLNFKNHTWKDSDFNKTETDESEDEVEQNNDITPTYIKEEKKYSKQWMGYYSKSDIEYLDNYLKGLHKDFKIVTENHKDYAKKIAKASLHMDACFRDVLEGVNGAEKKYKDAKEVFDTLSKSAQFSESQRGQNEVGLGCFGRVFELVENKIYIPEHIPLEKDDIDKLLDDLGHIEKSV